MPTLHTPTSGVAQFFRLHEMANATACLAATLPEIDLDKLNPAQQLGLKNSLNKLHDEIHIFNQRLAADEAVNQPNPKSI